MATDPTMTVRSTKFVHSDLTTADDLTDSPQYMAIVERGVAPTDADLLPATLVQVGPHGGPAIRVLVGPDGGQLDLLPGLYDVHAKVQDNPETEYEPIGQLRIRG